MKKRWGVLLFAAGLASGLLLRGHQTSPASSTAASSAEPAQGKSSRSRTSGNAPAAHDTKWAAFGKRAKAMDPGEKQKFVNDLPDNDRISALEALADQAGLDGLDPKVKSMMEQIIAEWTGQDFDGAWAAAGKTTNPHLRRFMKKTILGQLAIDDPERAYAMHLEEVAEDPDFKSSVAEKLVNGRLKVGASEYLEVLAQTNFGDSTGGWNLEFAPDFNFQQAADGVARLINENEGRQPPQFPSNFYSAWAAKDPEAAFKWWSENRSLPFGSIDQVIDEIEKQTPGASAKWAVSKLETPGEIRDKVIRELAAGSKDGLATRVSSIAQAMPDARAEDSFLTDIVAMNYANNPFERYGFAISAMSSVEARLETIRRMGESGRDTGISKVSDDQLRDWGVTRTQVEQLLGATKK